KDGRVKIGGYAVELFGVERALLAIPNVREAVVMKREDRANQTRLIAYLVVHDHDAAHPTELRAALGESLPAYMIPHAFVFLDKMPLNARGKVDRSALPAPGEPATLQREAPVPPKDQLETKLLQIWSRTLRLRELGVLDNFFELSGTSLQAFTIFAAIAEELGEDLPPTLMLKAPTVRQLADLLRSRALMTGGSPSLVTFRATGNKTPLFIVHGLAGNVMFARDFARHLEDDRPLYGLQPEPLDGAHPIRRTVEGLASHYLILIRAVQAAGPYLFAGYSLGGSIALEMAQQLRRAGETVSFLGIIDSAPNAPAPSVRAHLQTMKQLGAWQRVRYLNRRARRRFREFCQTVRRVIHLLPWEPRLRLHRPIPYAMRGEVFRAIHLRASHRYVTSPYPGPATIFARRAAAESQREAWRQVVEGPLLVCESPADHDYMVREPYVRTLAQQLNSAIAGCGCAAQPLASREP
ncbi:MAG: thioesterase domain-containing protein, partial [Candidatus Binataceae bacterium]